MGVNVSSQQVNTSAINKTTNWYVIRVSLIAALGGFLFGFETAVISGAEKTIQEYDLSISLLSHKNHKEITSLFITIRKYYGKIIK